MTEYVKLENDLYSVDMTNLNPNVQFSMNNPLFIVPATAGYQMVFNLNLLSVRLNVTFDLVDGIGTGQSTNFGKLLALSSAGNAIAEQLTFTWGGRVYFPVVIENIAVTSQPGKKDYMPSCTMTIVPIPGLA